MLCTMCHIVLQHIVRMRDVALLVYKVQSLLVLSSYVTLSWSPSKCIMFSESITSSPLYLVLSSSYLCRSRSLTTNVQILSPFSQFSVHQVRITSIYINHKFVGSDLLPNFSPSIFHCHRYVCPLQLHQFGLQVRCAGLHPQGTKVRYTVLRAE